MADKSRVLVVEDNDFVRMQIVHFLNDGGYETVECSDGEEALEEVSNNIDVAIVDIRMEPIDGFEFLRSIRGMDMATPVVLVTGDQNPDLLSEAAKWGVTAVLMKPVERDRLLKTVERIIQMRERAS
ncbi:MAG: response regulator [Alphaproteobacteria bacterium]|nr:response regulator [Alphaproteobacteria bacterium]